MEAAVSSLPPPAIWPAFLAQRIDELDRARGAGLIVPVFRITLLTFIPAFLIGLTVEKVAPGPEGPDIFSRPYRAVLAALLIAPALETLIMRYLLAWVGRMIREPFALALVCALLWGVAHVQSPSWGLHAVWGFYVMNAVFLRLQARSLNRAYAVVILLHALFNAIAYGVYLLG